MLSKSPVIILASSQRSGSTLIQRLLCSSENTLIYGDLIGQEVDFFTSYISARIQMYEYQNSLISPLRESVDTGLPNQFIASMIPEKSLLTAHLKTSALQWLESCKKDASKSHRSIWGWKHAGASPHVIQTLPEWLPDARFIALDRNVIDSACSAKAAEMIHDLQGLQIFCQNWQQSRAALFWLEKNHPERVLSLKFEELINNQKDTVDRLERHTGAKNIQSEIFNHKVNTLSLTPIPPADLNESEFSIVESFQNAKAEQVA